MPIFADEKPERKPNRTKPRDYSRNGAYFITVVTKEREAFLGGIAEQTMMLSPEGKITEDCIRKIERIYPSVMVDAYVIMPNHVHMLLVMLDEIRNPTLSRIIQQWKGAISKEASLSFWQTHFYDHIILGPERYREVKQYIKSNPAKWEKDRFHPSNPFNVPDDP